MSKLRLAALLVAVVAFGVRGQKSVAQEVPGDGPGIECEGLTGTCVIIPIPPACSGDPEVCYEFPDVTIPGHIKWPYARSSAAFNVALA